ncbi:uncharacterized protein UMAG_10045 [Mycosarcoma maydis]|uniref:Uncharacterized protein n=1 Tax=Mycosarcoma maydis TaxID=5270 RepID=A0A0D1E753_MYCMD|nr:uncharacterized protein UMAG_10045 [Ustilago maydis 521]KIS71734.1 hypothetical protein UMAG_10045 [Ustilago maydis 521]|eukprot:XP_011386634.1 hypothetical protein UMAG_10045 [Ustilago maydis 521]
MASTGAAVPSVAQGPFHFCKRSTRLGGSRCFSAHAPRELCAGPRLPLYFALAHGPLDGCWLTSAPMWGQQHMRAKLAVQRAGHNHEWWLRMMHHS